MNQLWTPDPPAYLATRHRSTGPSFARLVGWAIIGGLILTTALVLVLR